MKKRWLLDVRSKQPRPLPLVDVSDLAVMDENESPVEVHLTKNLYFNFKGFAGVLHRERN